MACTGRKTSSAVIEQLFAHPQRFSYEQIMRLLHWQGISAVRTRPNLSLGFPATDVVALEQQEQQVLITTNLLGLYGPSSPLPTFYTEALFAEAAEDGSATREFYDLLNQPLYDHYFQAWTKYRLMLCLVESHSQQIIERLYALLGLADPALHKKGAELLPYLGLLGQLPRSALGLETLLSHAMGCKVELEPFVAHWVDIPPLQYTQLGEKSHQLGGECYLGTHCLDNSTACHLHLQVEEAVLFAELLPAQPRYLKIARLLSHYLLDPLQITLWIWPHIDIVPPACLEHPPRMRLGINSWLADDRQPTHFPFATQLCLGVH